MRRTSLRTRIVATIVVPCVALLVVVALAPHRSAVTIASAVGVVVLSAVIALLVVRSIRRPLDAIRHLAADATAFESVGRVRVSDDIVAPRTLQAGGELADLALSVAEGRRVASELLRDAADDRRSTVDLVGRLAVHNERLLERALDALTEISRRDHDPNTASALAQVHRTVARVDRATASELVLLGRERRPSSRSAPITDIVWGAAIAIASSDRVDALDLPPVTVVAGAVGDVAHIVAEVLDNAVQASTADERVVISGAVGHDGGFELAVVDAGRGMSAFDLTTANRRIRRVDVTARVPSHSIGFDVVGRLARRHGVTVTLHPADTGGVDTRIALPATLIRFEAPVPSVHLPSIAAEADEEIALEAPDDATPIVFDFTASGPIVSMPAAETTVGAIEADPRSRTPEPFDATDDLVPTRSQPKWAAAIAARTRG